MNSTPNPIRFHTRLFMAISLALLSIGSLQLSGQSCTTATCTAASTSESDVLAALPSNSNVNATVVVNIPAGTGLWTSQLTYTIPTAVTSLTIQGATSVNCTGTAGTSSYACTPTDATIIQDNVAGSFGVWQFFGSSGGSAPLLRFTGITLQGGTGLSKGQGLFLLYSQNNGSQIRFDHNHINETTYTGGPGTFAGRINGCWIGVIDHNVFDNASTSDTASVVQGFDASNTCNDSLGYGDGSWAFATGFGTSNFLFQESNVFNGGLEGDCDTGGKFVSRYNTLNSNAQRSSWIHSHGTEHNGGRARGCRAYEAYHDYFNVAGSGSVLFGGDAGTSIAWGNTINHTTALFSSYGDERNDGQHHQIGTPTEWGFCGTSTIDPNTGLPNGSGSAWDGNSNTASGWPCLDGLGRGQGQALNGANFPGALNSVTGTIAWPHQNLEPVYQWMNTLAGTPQITISGTAAIQNRDLFVDNASFNGTTGTGFGLLSARPATCTAGPGGTFATSPTGSYGVGYWATDANSGNGELYVCTATNTWTGIYQPYTYPHPLVSPITGFTLSAGITGSGLGVVTCSPSPGTYPSGTGVSCTGAASGGSTFTSLTGTGSASGCSGTGACVFSITANSTVLGTFVANALTPGFSPIAGAYGATQTVTISSGTSGATLCYTVDGSTPTANGAGTCTHGTTYSMPISVSTSQTVKALASKSGFNDSTVGSAAYTINGAASTPTFSPVAGTYATAQNVTISSSTSGATLCYTTDGSSPTANGAGLCTHGVTYSGTVLFSSSLTLKALASKNTFLDSSVGSAAYVINGAVADPTFSPIAGTYNSTQTVTLASATSGAAICFTVDGSTPTASSGSCTHGTTYSTPVSVAVSETIQAIASKSLFANSSVTSAAYSLVVTNVSFSPAAGSYASTQTVAITTATPSGVICYTVDGSTPTTDGAGTCTHGTTYSGTISVATSQVVTAVGTKSGYTDSPINSAAYVINGTASTPTFSPAAGTYSAAQTVTLSTTTGGVVSVVAQMTETSNANDLAGHAPHRNVYTNCAESCSGGVPQPPNSGIVSHGTLWCDPSEVVSCGSFGSGSVSSTISGTGTGVLENGMGAGGTDSATSVTATYAGTTGTGCGVGTTFTSNLVPGLTLPGESANARGVFGLTTAASGFNTSMLAVSKYNTNGDAGNNLERIDCASPNTITAGGQHYEWDSNYNTTGGSYMGFGMDYNFATSKLRACFQNCSGWTDMELCPVGGGGCITTYSWPAGNYLFSERRDYWDTGCTSSGLNCAHYGQICLQLWSAGSPVNSLTCYNIQNASTHAQISATPINKTTWTHPQYGVQHQWDVNSGSKTLTASVAFDSLVAYSNSGNPTICYTTDGSTPTGDGAGTCTHGTTYSAPISVGTTTTIKAIATAAGFTDSGVGSATYTLTTATPTFSPAAGTYASTQNVTITSVTSGATIYYTTDGSTPTTSSTLYTGPVTVASSLTLKAIAVKASFNDSVVGSSAYVISAGTVTSVWKGKVSLSGRIGVQ